MQLSPAQATSANTAGAPVARDANGVVAATALSLSGGLSTARYLIDSTDAGSAWSPNEIRTFPSIAGGLVYIRLSAGDAALFILNSATSVGIIYGDTTNVFSLTPSAAGKVSVYMSAGALKIENKYGAVTITGFVFKA